jgi:NTP pyrophosphatase (non-canonical NTP hydrolase)
MNLDEYQDAARRTLNVDWPEREQIANAVMGLAGEAGEIADLYKKKLYHGHDVSAMQIIDELGDLLWYLAAVASLEGLSLADIARQNIDKLKVRYPNGFTKRDSILRADKTGFWATYQPRSAE